LCPAWIASIFGIIWHYLYSNNQNNEIRIWLMIWCGHCVCIFTTSLWFYRRESKLNNNNVRFKRIFNVYCVTINWLLYLGGWSGTIYSFVIQRELILSCIACVALLSWTIQGIFHMRLYKKFLHCFPPCTLEIPSFYADVPLPTGGTMRREIDDVCAICLERFLQAQRVVFLPCSPALLHYFHDECIAQWLTAHHSCPLCRTILAVASPIQNPAIEPTQLNLAYNSINV
jgi:hypothetical protein